MLICAMAGSMQLEQAWERERSMQEHVIATDQKSKAMMAQMQTMWGEMHAAMAASQVLRSKLARLRNHNWVPPFLWACMSAWRWRSKGRAVLRSEGHGQMQNGAWHCVRNQALRQCWHTLPVCIYDVRFARDVCSVLPLDHDHVHVLLVQSWSQCIREC